MKAIEFPSHLNPDQTLAVPASVAGSIPVGQTVRVLVLIAESDVDLDWEELTATEFGQGYTDGNAIYDHLSSR